MINPRISADWSTTKPIAAFSCTPHVQIVDSQAEVVHLTPGLLGLWVLFNGTISKRIFRTINNVNKYGKGVMCVI